MVRQIAKMTTRIDDDLRDDDYIDEELDEPDEEGQHVHWENPCAGDAILQQDDLDDADEIEV